MSVSAPMFSLRPLTPSPSDAHAVATCFHTSFATDPFAQASFPITSIPERIRDLESRWMANYISPTAILVKAVSERSGEMVGYAKWEAPTPEMASEIRDELFMDSGRGTNRPIPEEGADLERREPLGLNDDLAEESTESMVSVRDGYLKGRDVLKLVLLATIPEWRGKGVGSALLKWGLKVADKKGFPVWVDASLCL